MEEAEKLNIQSDTCLVREFYPFFDAIQKGKKVPWDTITKWQTSRLLKLGLTRRDHALEHFRLVPTKYAQRLIEIVEEEMKND